MSSTGQSNDRSTEYVKESSMKTGSSSLKSMHQRLQGSCLVQSLTNRTGLYSMLFLHGIAQLFSSNAITNSSSFFMRHVQASNMGFLVMDYLFVILTFSRLVFLIFSSYFLSWV